MKVLILGFGDVGKSVTQILTSRGVEVVVVDVDANISPEYESESVKFVEADATSEEFWEGVDLNEFDAVVIALPNDLHAIFCTLTVKDRAEIPVFARCNNSEYAEKLYRAGADHVINLPVVAAEMVLAEIFKEEIKRRLTFEDIEIKVYSVDERLEGKRVSEIITGNVVFLGAECDGEVIRKPNLKLRKGCRIAVAGKREDLLKFEAGFISS